MTKSIFTATASNGQTFKRTSESRTYTHCVAVRQTVEQAIAEATAQKIEGWDWGFYVMRCLKAGLGGSFMYTPTMQNRRRMAHRHTVDTFDFERGQRLLTEHSTRDGYIAHLRDENIRRIRERSGADDRFRVVGWCGRHDLAHKLAATQLDGFCTVEILEAVRVK